MNKKNTHTTQELDKKESSAPEYKDQEIVICAAIKTGNHITIRGHRHADCIRTASQMSYVSQENLRNRIEGFITSRNRFVDRVEGLKIQKEAGIKSKSPGGYVRELYSEDLY